MDETLVNHPSCYCQSFDWARFGEYRVEAVNADTDNQSRLFGLAKLTLS